MTGVQTCALPIWKLTVVILFFLKSECFWFRDWPEHIWSWILLNLTISFRCVFLIHFSSLSFIYLFLKVIDLLLSVNVEFMLCPTSAMTSVFSLVPKWVLYPTYRTIITYLVFIIGPMISIGYMYAAKLVLFTKSLCFSTQKKVSVNQSIKKQIW